jgi:hypothetical protein
MVLIPNANTAAMTPLGHVAGMGAAILGFVSTAVGAVLGSVIDGAFDGTVGPFATFALGYVVVAVVAILGIAGVRRTVRDGPHALAVEGGEPLASL